MRGRLLVVIFTVVLLLAGGYVLVMFMTPPADAPPVEPASTASSASATASTPKPAAKPATSKPIELTPTPAAAPTTGTLIIESDVPDTSVFIDRVFLGTAPVTAVDIKPGPHTINLSASGYDGIVETIDVVPGPRTLSVKFKEIRLNASIAVVHKHAIGSCSGTLRATPQGLTYDTTNKEDAFSTVLTNLETFAFDYLQKNLRVKIKGGKTLNFTDLDGNADRLYAFHRDVDRARQRLLAGR